MSACRVLGSAAAGALATATLVSGTLVPAGDEEFYAISGDFAISVTGLAAGEGPLLVGCAHGDYTDAEIEEAVEATTSISRGDLLVLEKSRRKVRTWGTLTADLDTIGGGEVKRCYMGMSITTGEDIRLWVYNLSAGQLTTGAIVKASGTMFLRYT